MAELGKIIPFQKANLMIYKRGPIIQKNRKVQSTFVAWGIILHAFLLLKPAPSEFPSIPKTHQLFYLIGMTQTEHVKVSPATTSLQNLRAKHEDEPPSKSLTCKASDHKDRRSLPKILAARTTPMICPNKNKSDFPRNYWVHNLKRAYILKWCTKWI